MALLTVNHLAKSFGTNTVFSDVTFEVGAGDRIGLVGVNGCGKTTLVKTLCGLESADDGSMFASVFGAGRYAVHQGNDLAATLVNSNSVQVDTGAGFIDGRYFRVTSTETLTIDSGSQGDNRIDLVGFKYQYDSGTQTESGSLAVVKGTPTSGTPSLPTYTDGDITAGATEAFFPLYSIEIDGITPSTPVKLFNFMSGTVSCPWPVGSVLQMTNATNPNDVYPGTTWQEIQGMFLLGSSSGHALGTSGGAETVTLTSANMPAHTHTYDKANATSGSTTLTVNQIPSHTHSFNLGQGNGSQGSGKYVVATPGNVPAGLVSFTTGVSKSDANNNTGGGQAHTHSVGTSSTNSGSTGSGTAVSTMPPYKVVNMWERTA